MARSVDLIDRYLAHIAGLRRRAPDARFRQIMTRRLDALLDERLEAAPVRSAPVSKSPEV